MAYATYFSLSTLLTLLALLVGCGGSAPAPDPQAAGPATATPPKESLTYCSPGGEPLTLDVYRQPGARLRPAAVFFHGGGFKRGSSAFEPGGLPAAIARSLHAEGFVVASVNYRLAPASRWPAMIVDARCAIRYLRAHAQELGIDPDRIAACGNSAGGMLASLLGISGGGPVPGWDEGAYLDQSSAVQAVVDLWGPTDVATLPARKRDIASIFGKDRGVWAEASPIRRIGPDAPPFFIVHGERDTVVPQSQSSDLREALEAAGAPVVLRTVRNAGHGLEPTGGSPQPSLDQLASSAVAFLVEQLG